MALQSFDRYHPLGRVSNDLGVPLTRVVDEVFAGLASEANATFNARRADLGRAIDVAPHSKAAELLGPIDEPAPIPFADNTEPSAINFASANTVPKLVGYGSKWTLSTQRAASLSLESLTRAVRAQAQHAFDGVVESVTDVLEALSLGTSQTSTTVQEGLSEFAALNTPGGGYPPALGAALVDESLRGRAANERWNEWGIPLVFIRGMTAGRFYLLPAPDSGTVVMPTLEGFAVRHRSDTSASAGWIVSGVGFAADAPTVRSSYVVRVTL